MRGSALAMGETANAERLGFEPWLAERLGTVLTAEVAAGRIPGAVVAVARRGELAALEAVGTRDPATGAPMTVDAVFSIASMTKPMVSVAILQLLEEGRLLLGDPVSAYLPQLARLKVATGADLGGTATPARLPTIQDLLRHTSGMTYQDRGTSPAHARYPGSSISAALDLSSADFLERMADAPLLFEPGTGWEYGFSTDILGLVVEAVEGAPLADVLARRLWSPLAMADTAFELSAGMRPRYARALAADPGTGQPQRVLHALEVPQRWSSGGGGALSTAIDYLRFCEMLRQGGRLDGGRAGAARCLGPQLVQLMTADHLPPACQSRIADSMDPAAAGYGFGLGVAVRLGPGRAAMPGSTGDYYWSGVYGTYFWIDPKQELSAVFMAAAPGLIRMRYRQLMRAIVYGALVD